VLHRYSGSGVTWTHTPSSRLGSHRRRRRGYGLPSYWFTIAPPSPSTYPFLRPIPAGSQRDFLSYLLAWPASHVGGHRNDWDGGEIRPRRVPGGKGYLRLRCGEGGGAMASYPTCASLPTHTPTLTSPLPLPSTQLWELARPVEVERDVSPLASKPTSHRRARRGGHLAAGGVALRKLRRKTRSN